MLLAQEGRVNYWLKGLKAITDCKISENFRHDLYGSHQCENKVYFLIGVFEWYFFRPLNQYIYGVCLQKLGSCYVWFAWLGIFMVFIWRNLVHVPYGLHSQVYSWCFHVETWFMFRMVCMVRYIYGVYMQKLGSCFVWFAW